MKCNGNTMTGSVNAYYSDNESINMAWLWPIYGNVEATSVRRKY